MSELLEKAIVQLRQLPAERQEAFARVLIDFVRSERALPHWTSEQIAEIEAGLADADAGDFLSEREVEEMYEGFRRRARRR